MTDSHAIDEARAAIGRRRVIRDGLAPEAVAKLAVLMDAAPPEDLLPPTWHWIFFNRPVAEADQGADLHERTGLFLPAAPFPRRMWAAGEVTLHRPLRIGVPATQAITVADVAHKSGRTGEMCFVTLALEVEQEGAACIAETRTIVYRDRGSPEPALRAPGDPVPKGFSTHSDGKLFFYSAVTHNGHRIHWDRQFCREVEGYPDLVVHGPLMATELCEALRDGAEVGPCRYSYRVQAPVFTSTPVRIEPGTLGPDREGLIRRSDGVVSMIGRLRAL
jgi:3-methylfumaryl-CoA hydratase